MQYQYVIRIIIFITIKVPIAHVVLFIKGSLLNSGNVITSARGLRLRRGCSCIIEINMKAKL